MQDSAEERIKMRPSDPSSVSLSVNVNACTSDIALPGQTSECEFYRIDSGGSLRHEANSL